MFSQAQQKKSITVSSQFVLKIVRIKKVFIGHSCGNMLGKSIRKIGIKLVLCKIALSTGEETQKITKSIQIVYKSVANANANYSNQLKKTFTTQ